MKFVLISRHTGGREPTPEEGAQLMQDLGAWLGALSNPTAIAIRGGKSVTAGGVADYVGDVGGVILFDAADLAEATRQAQKSPGLKFGWTHEIFPEITMKSAAGT